MPAPAFLVLPNGSSLMTEEIEHRCHAAEPARDGTDDIRCVRALPRLTFGAQFTLLSRVDEADLADLPVDQALWVPAWMHPLVNNGDGSFSVDAIATPGLARRFVVRETYGGALTLITSDVSEDRVLSASGFVEGWPAVEARLSDESFQLEYITPTVRTTNLAFTSYNTDERPSVPSPLVLPAAVDGSSAIQVQRTFAAVTQDEGGIVQRKPLHTKRQLSAQFTLMSRAQVLAFRRFVYSLRGRSGSFTWQSPLDATPQQYRLAADTTRIDYLKPSLARCTLALVDLDA